jgi:hypothetical protein
MPYNLPAPTETKHGLKSPAAAASADGASGGEELGARGEPGRVAGGGVCVGEIGGLEKGAQGRVEVPGGEREHAVALVAGKVERTAESTVKHSPPQLGSAAGPFSPAAAAAASCSCSCAAVGSSGEGWG